MDRYMLKVAASRALITAILTAVIVFASCLLTAIESDQITELVVVSAVLTAVVAFIKKYMGLTKDG